MRFLDSSGVTVATGIPSLQDCGTRDRGPGTRPRTPPHKTAGPGTRPRTPPHKNAGPGTRPRTLDSEPMTNQKDSNESVYTLTLPVTLTPRILLSGRPR